MKKRKYLKEIEKIIKREVEERVSFDELESLNDKLIKENQKLLNQISVLNEKLTSKNK